MRQGMDKPMIAEEVPTVTGSSAPGPTHEMFWRRPHGTWAMDAGVGAAVLRHVKQLATGPTTRWTKLSRTRRD